MAGTVSKEALLKILGENKDALAKLEEISVKADELKASNPELTVKIDKEKALAEARLLKAELKTQFDVNPVEVPVKPDVSGFRSLIDRALVGSSFAGGGSNNIGGLMGATEGLSSGLLTGLVVAIPAIEGLLVLVTGLVSGLAAAGAGATAFGLLALPTFEKIKNAYTSIATAQTAYNTAVTKEQLDPTKSNAKAVATALLNLQAAQAQAGPATTQAITGISNLKTAFDKLAQALQPEVMQIFNGVLKVANDLLPTLKAPAEAFAGALGGLLTQLDQFVKSKGFADWLKKFDQDIGPATTAIGQGLGKVLIAFGKLLTVMSSHDVAHAINVTFDIITGIINTFTGIVSRLMSNWDRMTGAFKTGWDTVARVTREDVGQLVTQFDTVKRIFTADIPSWLDTAVNWFKALPGRIIGALGKLSDLLWNAGIQIIEGFLSGLKRAWNDVTGFIGGIGSWIASHKGPVEADALLLVPHGKAIMGGLIGGMRSQVPALQSTLAGVTGTIGGFGGVRSGGGGVQVVFSGAGAAQFRTLVQALWPDLKMQVRTTGGGGPNSAQIAFGQVH